MLCAKKAVTRQGAENEEPQDCRHAIVICVGAGLFPRTIVVKEMQQLDATTKPNAKKQNKTQNPKKTQFLNSVPSKYLACSLENSDGFHTRVTSSDY